MPCPDEYCDMGWVALLGTPEPPPNPHLFEQNLHPAYWAVGGILIAVAVYELVAILSHYVIPTISQGVQRGPRWYRWSLSAGLGVLIYHFLFQGRPKS
jgi:hypothetical protein